MGKNLSFNLIKKFSKKVHDVSIRVGPLAHQVTLGIVSNLKCEHFLSTGHQGLLEENSQELKTWNFLVWPKF